MNDRNDIDQLFSRKLGKAGVQPSAAAWEKLEGNLNSQRKSRLGFYIKIAAAVIILLLSVFSLMTFSNDDGIGPGLADNSTIEVGAPFPKRVDLQSIDIALVVATAEEYIEESKKTEKNILPVQPQATDPHLPNKRFQRKAIVSNNLIAMEDQQATQVKDQLNATTSPADKIVTDEATLKEIGDLTKAVAVEDSHPGDEQPNTTATMVDNALEAVQESQAVADAGTTEDLPSVTITYVGDSEEKKKPKFSLKKVFNSAKKLAKGDLIADLRDAKDELINFKIKSLNDD